jgi:hypothetical protein
MTTAGTGTVRIFTADLMRVKKLKLAAEERGVRGLTLADWMTRAVNLLVYEETVRPVTMEEQQP